MPDLSPQARRAMRYWSAIEGAANDRATTADLWQAIHDVAEAAGLASPGVSIQGVNELRAYANELRRSRDALQHADPSGSIGADMIGHAPWARSEAEQATLPVYQVKFQHTTLVDGKEQTDWRSTLIRGGLPESLDALQAMVEADAVNYARGYQSGHVGIGSLQVYQV